MANKIIVVPPTMKPKEKSPEAELKGLSLDRYRRSELAIAPLARDMRGGVRGLETFWAVVVISIERKQALTVGSQGLDEILESRD